MTVPAAAQVDTLRPRPDTLGAPTAAAADTAPETPTGSDTVVAVLPRAPAHTPLGPLPAGKRLVYDVDSLRFNGLQTLADLLAHVPGVHVGRGGYFGQPEPLFLAGRGAAALEVYWDGVPYLPLGRDSVFLDAARIPLGPLERVEVVVLPAAVQVYLVSFAPRHTDALTSIEIATGLAGTAVYRGMFARRWRSGLGLAVRADFGATDGFGGTSSTKYRGNDLWARLEYAPSPRYGVEAQLLAASWKRDSGASGIAERDERRTDRLVRVYYRSRTDGLGLRAHLAFATSGIRADSALAPDSGATRDERQRSEQQVLLGAGYRWRRGGVTGRAIVGSDRIPLRVELAAAWSPLDPLTLALEGRRMDYVGERSGERLHASAGLALPLGFALRGDAALGRDLHAAEIPTDTAQEIRDFAVALRWERSFVALEAEAGRRSAFAPTGFPTDLLPAAALLPTPETEYLRVSASVRPLPGLALSGWYADPLTGGGDFEPPRRARYAATFHSKFWRKFRSGAFTLHAEVAAESWSRGTAGRDSTGAPLLLPGATFVETNLRLRILDLTIFWAVRNVALGRQGYLPGRDYPRSVQYYGVHWAFRN